MHFLNPSVPPPLAMMMLDAALELYFFFRRTLTSNFTLEGPYNRRYLGYLIKRVIMDFGNLDNQKVSVSDPHWKLRTP